MKSPYADAFYFVYQLDPGETEDDADKAYQAKFGKGKHPERIGDGVEGYLWLGPVPEQQEAQQWTPSEA